MFNPEGGFSKEELNPEDISELIRFIDSVLKNISGGNYPSIFSMMGERKRKIWEEINEKLNLDKKTRAILSAYFSEKVMEGGLEGFRNELINSGWGEEIREGDVEQALKTLRSQLQQLQ